MASNKVSLTQINNFINMLAPIAQAQAKKHGNKIYASVCIAQACQESGFGTSAKMTKANALFGIKVGNSAYKFGTAWKGAAYKTGTTEYYDGKNPTKIVDWFRQYDSIEDATEDYFDMLCHCKRYKPALNQPTPEACIRAIVAGGYATGPSYADHIITLINKYNLTKYDGKVSAAPVAGTPKQEKVESSFVTGRTYTTRVNLYVRKSANGDKMKLSELTDNARAKAFTDADGNAILKSGTRVTCKDSKVVGNSVWVQIPSGWVCAVPSNGAVYIS